MRRLSFKIKRFSALILSALLLVQSAVIPGGKIESYAQTGTVNADRLNLRSGPGTGYRAVTVLSTNARVEVGGSVSGTDGYTWYQVNLSNGTSGYLRSDFVNLSVTYAASDDAFENYLNEQGFPESYKNALRGLHQKYPSWVFKAQHTGLDWNEAVREEAKIGRNLTESDSISSWKSIEDGAFDWAANYWPGFDGATWVAASEDIIKHYMDPRNFLSDPYVFQFELQSYDPSAQTKEGLQRMVSDTFLSGTVGQKNTGNGEGTGPGSGSTAQRNSSSYGPGSGSPSGSTASSFGPGMSGTQNTTQNNSQNTSIGPDTGVVLVAPGAVSSISSLLGCIVSYAAWENLGDRWVYRSDDGSLKKSGWYWLDGNKDGTAECYYFDADGTMAADKTIDGYYVNSDGAWIENGKVQRKNVSGGSLSPSSSQSTQSSSYTSMQGTGTLYTDLIMEAAKQSGVSPYVLAAMIIQEQGKTGTSPLISGSYGGYQGYYNFYNIAAYEHDGMSAIEAGLKYASESGNAQRPWNTVEKGIIGGAIAYGANYTDNGQDTFYLKKFNVQGKNKYNHQFMTNVVAAAQEGAKVGNAYPAEIKSTALCFKIPVYLNMPEIPCELPQGKGSPNNKLSGLTVEGFSITPTFNMNTTEYSLIVDTSVEGIQVNATAIDQGATVSGTGYMSLAGGLNQVIITVTAGNGTVRTYRLSITKQAGGATYNGSSTPQGPGSATGPGGALGPGSGTGQQNSQGMNGPSVSTSSGQTAPGPSAQSASQPAQSTGSESHSSQVIIGAPPM